MFDVTFNFIKRSTTSNFLLFLQEQDGNTFLDVFCMAQNVFLFLLLNIGCHVEYKASRYLSSLAKSEANYLFVCYKLRREDVYNLRN